MDLKSDSGPRLTPWRVLRTGPFARYMSGELVSMLGTWMQQMALGWVVTALTTSAFTLGLINLASGLPMLALTMWGGVVADRFDKRRILLATQVVQALIAVAIGWLVARGQITVWHIAQALGSERLIRAVSPGNGRFAVATSAGYLLGECG